MQALSHFKTIHRHRALVRKYCFRLGLYWQGLTHDLSKYSPTEFLAGAHYYQGTRSPNDAQRRDVGFSAAWMHHKGRNRHHFEFWNDYSLDGSGITGIEMPPRYLAEMFCDRLAASKVYRGSAYQRSDPYEFFQYGKGRNLMIHPAISDALEQILLILKDEGEDAAFAHIRKEILKK